MKLYNASIYKRIAAHGIDIFGVNILVGSSAIVIDPLLDISESLFIVYYILVISAYIFYIPLMEGLNNGQTLGKMAMRIRVVRPDGMPITFVHSIQRYLMLFVDMPLTLCVGGILSTNLSKRRQRLGDMVADTMVVDTATLQKPYRDAYNEYGSFTAQEQEYFRDFSSPATSINSDEPLQVANYYRSLQSAILAERTAKGNTSLIKYLESALGYTHLQLFKHRTYTIIDIIKFTIRSIPQAVYRSRWAIVTSLAISVIAYFIGVFSQYADSDFFESTFGSEYTAMTIENIENGNPMGVYGRQGSLQMFTGIFFNNLTVTLRLYIMGLMILFGPLMILISNFVSFGAFDAFFAQNGLLATALITPQLHGTLELSSVIMAGGAAIRLGTGWLFPGKLTRRKAFTMSARQSILILLSTIPMLFVAAIIESFVTRHTEWPLGVKCAIIIISFIFIVVYYVMLPIRARRQ